MKSANRTMITFAIIMLSILPGSLYLDTPNLNLIAQDYSAISENIVIMVSTLPLLAAIPACLLAPVLCKRFGYKPTSIFGTLVLGLGGFAPFFLHNFTVLLGCRIVAGIGYGLLFVIPVNAVGLLIPPEKQAGMYGVVTATSVLSFSIFSIIGGWLGNMGMSVVWLAHLVVFVLFIPFLLFFPAHFTAEDRLATPQEPTREQKKVSGALPITFFIVLLLHMVASGQGVLPMNYMSYIIDDRGLGGSSVSGVIIAIMPFVGFFASLFVGKAVAIFKRSAVFFYAILATIGIFTVGAAHSLPMLMIGGILVGADNGTYSCAFVHVSWLVPPEKQETANSIITAGLMAAGFFMLYIPTLIIHILNLPETYGTQMTVAAIVYAVVAVLFFVLFRVGSFKKSIDVSLVQDAETTA